MPILQKRYYQQNNSTYIQYRLTISKRKIESLGWNGKDTIQIDVIDGKLVCKNLSKTEEDN